MLDCWGRVEPPHCCSQAGHFDTRRGACGVIRLRENLCDSDDYDIYEFLRFEDTEVVGLREGEERVLVMYDARIELASKRPPIAARWTGLRCASMPKSAHFLLAGPVPLPPTQFPTNADVIT